jgi:hypothetical protein
LFCYVLHFFYVLLLCVESRCLVLPYVILGCTVLLNGWLSVFLESHFPVLCCVTLLHVHFATFFRIEQRCFNFFPHARVVLHLVVLTLKCLINIWCRKTTKDSGWHARRQNSGCW